MHLGKRLIWHQQGWDGTICKCPAAQIDCQADSRNARYFDLEIEQQLAGERWEPTSYFDRPNGRELVPKESISKVLYENGKKVAVRQYRPPCWESINTYGRRPFTYRPPTHGNRYASREQHLVEERPKPKIKFKAQDWEGLKGGTFIATPYRSLLEDAGAVSEPARPWTLDPGEETRRLQDFWSVITEGRSYVLFFCRGHHPYEDDCPILPVGLSAIDWKAPQRFHGQGDSVKGAYPVWQRAVHHAWPEEGFRIPWHLLDYRVAQDLARTFNSARHRFPSYETEAMQSRQLAPIVAALLHAVESAGLPMPEERWGSVSWLTEASTRLRSERELRPSLPHLLTDLQIDRPIHLAASLELSAIESNRDPLDFVFAEVDLYGELKKRAQDIDDLRRKLNGLSRAEREWRLLLTQFALRPQQYYRLSKLGAHPESRIEDYLANPYLLLREPFDDPDEQGEMEFQTIDEGLRADSRGSPYFSTVTEDDSRRLSSLTLQQLDASRRRGSTQLPLRRMPLGVRKWLAENDSQRAHGREKYVRLKLGDEQVLALHDLYDAELDIAKALRRLQRMSSDAAYANRQDDWNRPGVYAIHGSAGTGKTHQLVEKLKSASGWGRVRVLAPTGRAATVLTERLGAGYNPTTIHAFLQRSGWIDNGIFKAGKGRVDVNTLIIDESSMVDSQLLSWLLRAIDKRSLRRVIFVGDPNQLPPIEAGRPFHDILSWLRLKWPEEHRIEPKDQFRSQQPFAEAVHRLFSRGEFTLGDLIDRIEEQSGETFVRYWLNGEELTDALRDPIGEIARQPTDPSRLHVLSVRNKGIGGVEYLNHAIWIAIGGDARYALPLRSGVGGAGDKVVQVRNSWLWVTRGKEKGQLEIISNGSLGVIKWATRSTSSRATGRKIIVSFPDLGDAVARYSVAQAQSQLALGYATTVHKSQGSEFGRVVVVIPWSTRNVSKELLYTALTRHRSGLTILLQQPDRLDGRKALRSRQVRPTIVNRETLLHHFLVEGLPEVPPATSAS